MSTLQAASDGHSLDVDGRLAVEVRAVRSLTGSELPILVGEAQSPAVILANGNDEIDAALVGAPARNEKRAAAVICIGAACQCRH